MEKRNNDTVLILAAIGVGYFAVIQPLLIKLGIKNSKEEKDIEDQGNRPNQDNPFSPIFYKSRNCTIITRASADKFAKEIYDALGFWGDNEDQVINVFRQLKSKCQVSFLADVFAQNYKKDLYTFLRDGAQSSGFWGGLSDTDLNTVIKLVNSLT